MKNPGVEIRNKFKTHPIMMYALRARKEPFMWTEIEKYVC